MNCKPKLIVFSLILLLLSSCWKEDNYVSEGVLLDFSADTMAFDTVFTQMGTTTRQFMVYNRSNQPVRIREVTLQGGRASRFRLNVDGDTNLVAQNLIIGAGDSMFVFVRANINPNLQTEPFLIEDAVLFRFDDGDQRLPLTAYGRNAVYHVPTDTIRYSDGTRPTDLFGNPYAYSVIDCGQWRHDLPHVIIGYAVIDSRNTLSLTAGDELYFAPNSVLWVYDSATLDVRGTADRPVLFTSLRHDGWYSFLPGQWGYIWMGKGSVNNHIEHAVIENGYLGITADSCANANPTLQLNNVQIRNHTLAGLIGNTARIVADNLLITSCGTATLALQYGGDYTFSHCTLADYWRYDRRTVPSVQVTNYRDYDGIHYVWPIQANFSDCIIYGTLANELYLELDSLAPVHAAFTHCLIRGGEWDEDPLFVDPSEGDYHLQDDSPALGIGYQFTDK
ncbi:MAG: hypothetical protein J5641_00150 [Bacteroidales bacterium]|nr:hypothetical protein [Bacteroidales bacterium]